MSIKVLRPLGDISPSELMIALAVTLGALGLGADRMADRQSCRAGAEQMDGQCVDTACYNERRTAWQKAHQTPSPSLYSLLGAERGPAFQFNLSTLEGRIEDARARSLCETPRHPMIEISR